MVLTEAGGEEMEKRLVVPCLPVQENIRPASFG